MSIDACAELVARGDPDRFASAMTAPPELRARLMVLYAFNLEVARAPWVTQEEMIAEMRLQWWFDAIEEIFEDRNPRRHEVVTPLVEVIHESGLPRGLFDDLITARRRDIYRETPKDSDEIWKYLEQSSGGLLQLAAMALGIRDDAQDTAREFGKGMGSANLLVSLPHLRAAGWNLLTQENDIKSLAVQAQSYLKAARAKRRDVDPPAGAAFRAGWQADAILARAVAAPQKAQSGELGSSEFQRRLSLTRRALLRSW